MMYLRPELYLSYASYWRFLHFESIICILHEFAQYMHMFALNQVLAVVVLLAKLLLLSEYQHISSF
jgi:hypothetical protein